MPQKKINPHTRYSKAKSFGMRSNRTSTVLHRPPKVLAQGSKGATARVAQVRQPQRRTRRVTAQTHRASRTTAQRVVRQFFSHTITRAVVVLAVLSLFTATFVGRASDGLQTYRATPTNCTGWTAADNVRTIDAPAGAGVQDIPADKAATIQSRTADQPASGDSQLKCKSFTILDDIPSDAVVRSAQLVVSLAVQGNPDSEDVLVLESSLDGQQWNKLDSFFLTEDMSNGTHGGFWVYPFAKLEKDAISALQVRARFVSIPTDKQVSVRIDGMALDIGFRQQVSRDALNLPAGTVTIEKQQLQITEEPVVNVQITKASRLKFLGVHDTLRTVEDVQITDPAGEVVAATYDVSNVQTNKGVVSKFSISTDDFTKPGKYTTSLTVVEGNREAVVTSEFLWGVLVMNMNKSVYWPGETVSFGMGVLGPDGHTICDANLVLRVTAPDGSVQELTTEQPDGVQRSATCGPDNVTDVADYSADYDTFDAGRYQVTLQARTGSGEYTISDTVIVDPVIPIAIGRRGSMRIYPAAAYTMAVDVRPQQRYKGTVEEYLPPSFAVLTVSDGGKVIKGQQRTTIRWQVDIPHHTLKTLSYRYDAPDISPELFRLGPLQVGDVQESRQWQIASDIVGLTAVNTSSSTVSEDHEGEGRHLVFTNNHIGYVIEKNSAGKLVFDKTINGGLNWSSGLSSVAITDQTDVENYAVWYDGWTPGNAGSLIHIAFLENGGDTVYYDSIDTANSDTQKGEVAVYSDSATTRTSITDSLSITRATDGDLYIALASGAASSTAVVRYSTDVGTNWNTTAAEGVDDATQDYIMLMPLATADVLLFRWDVSANAIQTKEYEDGANAWDAGWTDISATATEDTSLTWNETWSATIHPSTYAIAFAYVERAGEAAATVDIKTYSYNGAAWTAKTDVETDVETILGTAIALDANTGDVYVTYTTGTTTASSPYYKVSSDGMATWSIRRGPVANIASNLRGIQANMVSQEMLGVWVYDDSAADIWYGTLQDIGTLSSALQTTNLNGFESQDSIDADGTSGSIAYSTTTYRSGAAALQADLAAGGTVEYVTHSLQYAATGAVDSTDRDVVQGVVAVRVGSGRVINQQTNIVTVLGGNTTEFEISINADQTLSITNDVDVNGTYALVDDTWYAIAFTANSDTGTAEVGVYSNDMTIRHDLMTQAQAMSDFDQVRVGVITAGTEAELYFDDLMVYAHDVVGNFPMLKGDYRIARMDADGVGTDTAWEGVNCAAGDYACINDIPTSTANYLRITAVGDETSNLETATNAGISGTFMQLRVMNTVNESAFANQTVVHAIRIRAGGIDETSSLNVSTTWTDFAQMYTPIDLAGLGLGSTSPYTVADLDSLEVGVGTDGDPGAGYYQNGDSVIQVVYAPSKILISGTAYTDEGSTVYDCASNNLTVAASTNGGASRKALCSTAVGTYTVVADKPATVADPIAVFIDSTETPKATTVTLASSTTVNVTGVDMYQDRLVLTHETETTTPITNAKLGTADNTDAGIRYGVADGNLTVESGIELHVKASKKYDPGGTITTNATGGDFHVDDNAIADIDTAVSLIGRDILVDGGATLNIDASVIVAGGDITTAGTSATITRTTGTAATTMRGSGGIGGGTTPAITFYDLTIGDGTTAATTLNSSVTTVDDVAIGTGSQLTAHASNALNVGGNWANSGTFTHSSGTVTFNAGDTGNTIDDGGSDWNNVIFNNAAGGWAFSNATTLAGDLTVTAGTLSGTADVAINGGDLTGDGTVSMSGGTVYFGNANGNIGGSGLDWTFANLYFDRTGTCTETDYTTTATGTNNFTITSVLTIDSCNCGETCSGQHSFAAGDKTYTLSGSGAPFAGGGAFAYDTSLVRYTGTGDTTITRASYDLELSPASGTPTYTFSVSVYHDVTIAAAVVPSVDAEISMYGNGNIDANENTVSILRLSGSSQTVTVSSNLSVAGALFMAAIDRTLSINSGVALTFSGATFGVFGTVTGDGLFTITSDSAGPGTGGTLSVDVRYDASAGNVANTTFDARTYGGDVEVYSSVAGIRTVTMAAGTHTISGNLTITGGASQSLDVTLDNSTTNPTVNLTGNLSFVKSGAGTPAITSGTGILTVSGNVNFTSGNYTASTGNTLKMNGTSKTLTSASQALQNFEVSGGSVASADAMNVDGTFTVSSGGFTQHESTNLNVAGAFTLQSTTTFTPSTSGKLILDGDLTFTDGTSPRQDLGDVEIGTSPDTTDLASDLTARSVTVQSGDVLNTNGYDLDIGIGGITVIGTLDVNDDGETDGTLMATDGKFDLQTGATLANSAGTNVGSTLTFTIAATAVADATSDLITAGTGSLHNLTINDGGGTYTITVEVEDAVAVDGDIAITGGVLDAKTGEDNAITVGGSWTNADIFQARSGTVTLTASDVAAGTVTVDSTGAGTASFNDLTLNDANGGDTFLLESALDINDDLLVTGGTLDTKTGENNAITIGGDWTNNDTFEARSGTVTADGAALQTFGGTLTSTSDFNNLVISNTSGSVTGCSTSFSPGVAFSAAATISGTSTINANGKVQFNSGSTYTITNISWVGTAGNVIYLRNSNLVSGTWLLNVSGTQAVSYVDVGRSDASGNPEIDASDGTNTNCENNVNWNFGVTGISISGSSNSSTGTVRVAVNGTEQAQTTTLDASWTISGVTVSSGNVVVVYVEGADAAETTGVSQYDGTGDMDGFVLNTNVLTIGNGDNQTIDLTDLAGYDCDDDEDVMFSSNAGTLAVQGCTNSYGDETLSTKASNTLSVGNSQVVTTDNLTNAGTLTSGTLGTFTVAGNWTNTSTFTPSTSTVTFSATDAGHTINNGAANFYNLTFDGSGGAWSPLTNTLAVTNDLTVTNGTFNTATGTANVTVNGNVQCGATCGTITMNTAGTNTFTQSVAASKAFGTNVAVATNWTFYNLTFTASAGTPTITTNGTGTGQIIVANALATTNSGTSLVVDNETNDRVLDVDGAVTIGAGTTLQASSTAAFTVAGNWTNNGDFTDGTGTVTLNGASQQTVDGQLTGASDRFYDLAITNASGSNPETSPSVIFAAAADTADDFIAQTANTKLRFLAGGTYTFQKVTFNGQATGTRVALRSSSTGTAWALNVAGTRAVSNTDVRDSNACGQAPDIDATDGTNFDATGNSCWQINTLTFAISDVAVGFGVLSPTAATWANGAATGSASAVAAHTLAVTTNATGGYALSYFGPTLVGPETIDAATFTADANGTPGSKQFALSITTDGDGTIPAGYQKASNNYSFVPSTTTTLMSETGATAIETASVYYICNVAAVTLPGAYSTNITYIATSTF